MTSESGWDGGSLLKLNVGGQLFMTSIQTLRKEDGQVISICMLSAMFSGLHKLAKDESGAYFIDRSPKHFEAILNFLRDGICTIPPTQQERDELIREASYYMLQGMVAFLDSTAKVEADLGMLNSEMKEQENHYRSLFVSDRENSSLSPHVLLIPVFDVIESTWDPLQDSHAMAIQSLPKLRFNTMCPAWCRKPMTDDSPKTRVIVKDLAEFKSNFNKYCHNMLEGLDWNGVLAAGGSVLHSVIQPERHRKCQWYSNYRERRDVDLFLYGMTPEQAKEKIKHIYKVIKANVGQRRVLIWRSRHCIAFYGDVQHHTCTPQIQVILRLYSGPAEVLMGFDLDCVTWGYDGSKVWCLPRGRRAINSMMNTVDSTRQSMTYEYRLAKYARRGFRIGVPGLEPSRIDIRVFTLKANELTGLAKLLHVWKEALLKTRFSQSSTLVSDKAERTTKLLYDCELAGKKKEVTADLDDVIRDGFRHKSDYDLALAQAANFSQLVECFLSAGCFPADVFDPSLARKCPFVFSVDDLERVWSPSNPMRVKLWSGDEEEYLYHTTILEPVSFLTVDPGRQYLTGSFHPQSIDWFKDAYYPPGIVDDPETKRKATEEAQALLSGDRNI